MTNSDSPIPSSVDNSSTGIASNEIAAASDTIAFLISLSRLALQGPLAATNGPAPLLALPRSFGRFQLEALLGTGSYGAVFRAVDTELDRAVAIKIAWPAVLMDAEASRRFIEEPKLVASLRHPGIVEVYDSGSVDMARYISFELIEGPTLADWLKSQDQVPVRVAAEIIRSVAEAVEFAHEHGIVHRDLKPSNILLRPCSSDGEHLPMQPVVTDFGLARRKRAVDVSNATATLAFVGTDRYMSPEQASGQASEIGPESDVFSLGVILYELVAGARPFDGENAEQIRARVQEDDPVPIRSLRKGVPRDLETIIFKCLNKSPDSRYLSAKAMAEDLRRFLAHEPIKARPTPYWRRAWKFTRRRPWAVSFVALGMAGVLAFAGLLGAFVAERRVAAVQIATEQAATKAAEGMERQHRYAQAIRNAASAQARGNRAEALSHLESSKRLASDPIQAGLEYDLLQLMLKDSSKSIPAHRGNISAVRFSPRDNVLVSGGDDSRVIYWDTKTWKPIRTDLHVGGPVRSIKFSADGALLAIGGDDGRVLVHRSDDHSIIFNQKIVNGRVFDVEWLGDEHRFAVGGEDATLYIVDPKNEKVASSGVLEPSRAAREGDPVHPNEIGYIAYAPAMKTLLVIKSPPEVVLFDLPTMKQLMPTESQEKFRARSVGPVCCVSPTSSHFAAYSAGDIFTFSLPNFEQVKSVAANARVEAFAYCARSKYLFSSHRDGSIRQINTDNPATVEEETRHPLLGHLGRAFCIDASPNGDLLASGGEEGSIRVWTLPLLRMESEKEVKRNPTDLVFSPCGQFLLYAEQFDEPISKLSLFEVSTGRDRWSASQKPLSFFIGAPLRVAWRLVDGELDEVVCLDENRQVVGRSPISGEIIKRYNVNAVAIEGLSLSPDGRKLYVNHGRTTILDHDSGRVLETTTGRRWIPRKNGTSISTILQSDSNRHVSGTLALKPAC